MSPRPLPGSRSSLRPVGPAAWLRGRFAAATIGLTALATLAATGPLASAASAGSVGSPVGNSAGHRPIVGSSAGVAGSAAGSEVTLVTGDVVRLTGHTGNGGGFARWV